MLKLANSPDPARLRYALYPVVLTTGAGDFAAETPSIGYPWILESVTLYSEILAGVTLSWNLLVDNVVAGGSRSPFDGVPIIRTHSDDTGLNPLRARHPCLYPLTLRPRFAWRQAGFHIRLAVSCTTNPWRVGAMLDIAPLPS